MPSLRKILGRLRLTREGRQAAAARDNRRAHNVEPSAAPETVKLAAAPVDDEPAQSPNEIIPVLTSIQPLRRRSFHGPDRDDPGANRTSNDAIAAFNAVLTRNLPGDAKDDIIPARTATLDRPPTPERQCPPPYDLFDKTRRETVLRQARDLAAEHPSPYPPRH